MPNTYTVTVRNGYQEIIYQNDAVTEEDLKPLLDALFSKDPRQIQDAINYMHTDISVHVKMND